MKEKITLVKVGGAIVEDPQQLAQLLKDFCAIEGKKVLVHGGGRRATQIATQMGVESQMVNGRRITDASMLQIVTMVYGGLVNKNLVAQLQANGINALGLTGADMNVIRSHKRPPVTVAEPSTDSQSRHKVIDYGFVGDVDGVDGQMLSTLIESGITPVMAPLTHDGQGNILNTNADTDDEESVIPVITREDFSRYVADGTVGGGMIPKLENAFNAIDAGVQQVIITLATAIDGRHGTVIKQ